MPYIVAVRRYHREVDLRGYDVAVPDEATHWLVVDEDKTGGQPNAPR